MNVRFASIIQLERRIKWEQSWNKRSKTTRLSTYRPPRGWAESILGREEVPSQAIHRLTRDPYRPCSAVNRSLDGCPRVCVR